MGGSAAEPPADSPASVAGWALFRVGVPLSRCLDCVPVRSGFGAVDPPSAARVAGCVAGAVTGFELALPSVGRADVDESLPEPIADPEASAHADPHTKPPVTDHHTPNARTSPPARPIRVVTGFIQMSLRHSRPVPAFADCARAHIHSPRSKWFSPNQIVAMTLTHGRLTCRAR